MPSPAGLVPWFLWISANTCVIILLREGEFSEIVSREDSIDDGIDGT